MKNLVAISVLIFSFFSCISAKIVAVSSDDVPLNNSVFVFENDTVKITYTFWANNGIMKFDIYNKLNNPIYCDWKNSAFIPNDHMVSYWQDATNTVGSSTSTSWLYIGIVNTKGASKSVHQERIGFIGPHSLITKNDFRLVKNYKEMPAPGNYNKMNSFLKFRNYLMFSTNEKFEGRPMIVDNDFYVNSIKKIKYNNSDKYKAQNSFIVVNTKVNLK